MANSFRFSINTVPATASHLSVKFEAADARGLPVSVGAPVITMAPPIVVAVPITPDISRESIAEALASAITSTTNLVTHGIVARRSPAHVVSIERMGSVFAFVSISTDLDVTVTC